MTYTIGMTCKRCGSEYKPQIVTDRTTAGELRVTRTCQACGERTVTVFKRPVRRD